MPPTPDLRVQRVVLHFDPACPWTWRTSRWLVDEAGGREVPIEYAGLELAAGRPIDELPAERRPAAVASRMFLRGVTVARARGRHDVVGRWYTAFGTARWRDHRPPTDDLVRATLASAGGTDLADVLDDVTIDPALADARREALEWAGDDVGSPVTVWHLAEHRRGFFGPVVAPSPIDTSGALWDAVVRAATVPEFFELKARRTDDPTDRRIDP